jgi:hypothetical protein
MAMDGGISPKLPTVFTGRETFRDTTAVSNFRTKQGLGTGDSVTFSNISTNSGSIGSLSSNSITSGYYYGSYSYVSYLYPYQCAANYLTAYNLLDVQAAMQLKTVLHTSDGQISDSETVVLCDAASGASCLGTPSTTDCTTYGTQGNCEANTNHGNQCTWNSVTCSSYNSNESACNAYHCTWEMASCAGFTNAMTCGSYYGCTWTEDTADCSAFNGDQSTCSGTTGCTWNYSDCTDFNGDESSCTGTSGCTWDGMGGCSGQYNTSCSGSYDPGTGVCSGSYATNNCLSSGVEGYCSGTVTCADGSSVCNAETGCTWTTGINLILPSGADGRTLRIQKVDSSGGVVTITVYNTSGQYLRSSTSTTLTTQWQDIWLTYYSSTATWS